MAYNAETAAANKAAVANDTMKDFAATLVSALRESIQPEPLPKIEVVTVGTDTSDPKLERRLFCTDCLDPRSGPAWGTHQNYRIIEDPERPGVPKKIPTPHAHPHVPKTISYDVGAARAALEKGTAGKQCLHCGAPLRVAV